MFDILKIKCALKVFILILCLAVIPAISPILTTAYTQTEKIIVANSAQIKSTGSVFIDGPWSSWTIGNIRYWLSSDFWGRFHHMFSGPVEAPVTTVIYNKKDYEVFTNRNEIDGQPWFTSIYKVSDTELLAFIHIERNEFDENDQYIKSGTGTIGLAYSKDNAQTFKYLGDVLSPENPEATNMQGTPYLVKDGYFHIYFNQNGTNVARARVSEVIAAAKQGNKTEWFKYYHGGWNEPGMGGKAESLNLPGICHTQAAYSTYDQKYYMVTTCMNWSGGNTYIKLWQSSDCVNWKLYQVIVNEPAGKYDANNGWQYSSIVDCGNEQNAVVGKQFYVYCGMNTTDLKNMYMARWTIDLGEVPVKNTPISKWSFDQNPNDSAGVNHGALYGAALFSIGYKGQAVSLDGEGSYIKIENSNTLNHLSQVTMSIWVYMKDYPFQDYSVFEKDWSYRIIIHKTGKAHFVIGTDSNAWYSAGTLATSSFAMEKNTWYNVVGTYDGNLTKIYINGKLEGTGPQQVRGLISTSDTPLRIGFGENTLDFFYGIVDEAKLYNKGLSASDVLNIYNTDKVNILQSSSSGNITSSKQSSISSNITGSKNAKSQVITSSGNISSVIQNVSSGNITGSSENSSNTGNTSTNYSSSEKPASAENKNNTALIIITICILTAAIGISGYFYYKKFIKHE